MVQSRPPSHNVESHMLPDTAKEHWSLKSTLVFGACSGVSVLPVASASILGNGERQDESHDVGAESI